jgi:YD repeat-containing protein
MDPVSHVEYAYDAVGNRIRMTADGNATDYYYDGANRLIQAGGTSFHYDENGNLMEKTNEAGNTIKYGYTADNMLQGIYYSDGTGVEYQYDAFRRKVARTQTYYDMDKIGKGLGAGQGKGRGQSQGRGNSDKGIQNAMNQGDGEKKGLIDQLLSAETTQYLYDGMNVFKEYGENAQPLAQYYYADGQVLAKKMFGLHGRKSDSYFGNLQTKGGLLYYQQDALGNVMDVTDRTGDIIQSYRYDVQVKWLEAAIEWTKNKYGTESVSLIAHSMGGITGAQYISDKGEDADIDKFVTINSPINGSEQAKAAYGALIGHPGVTNLLPHIREHQNKNIAFDSTTQVLSIASTISSFSCPGGRCSYVYHDGDGVVSLESQLGLQDIVPRDQFRAFRYNFHNRGSAHSIATRETRIVEEVVNFIWGEK